MHARIKLSYVIKIKLESKPNENTYYIGMFV